MSLLMVPTVEFLLKATWAYSGLSKCYPLIMFAVQDKESSLVTKIDTRSEENVLSETSKLLSIIIIFPNKIVGYT